MEFSQAIRMYIARVYGNEWFDCKDEALSDFAEKCREVFPLFSRQRLEVLLSGVPPSDADRMAVDHALKRKWPESHWRLEDDFCEIVRRICLSTKNPPLAKSIADSIYAGEFRYGNLTDREVDGIAETYLLDSQLEVEMDVFGLNGHDLN